MDAALRLLATATSITTEDIAREAGVGRATVFRHFDSQDALFAAAGERAFTAAGEALAAAELDRGSVESAARRAIDTLISLSTEYAALAASMTLGDELANHRADELLTPVAALITRGQRDGVIEQDMPARWLVDVLADLSFGAAFRGHGRSAEEQADLVERTFWQGARHQQRGDG